MARACLVDATMARGWLGLRVGSWELGTGKLACCFQIIGELLKY